MFFEFQKFLDSYFELPLKKAETVVDLVVRSVVGDFGRFCNDKTWGCAGGILAGNGLFPKTEETT